MPRGSERSLVSDQLSDRCGYEYDSVQDLAVEAVVPRLDSGYGARVCFYSLLCRGLEN